MLWALKPLLKSNQPTEKSTTAAPTAATDIEAGRGGDRGAEASGSESAGPEPEKAGNGSKLLPPSDHFTLHQIFYIFVLDGIVSGIIAGGINFAIAYALYHDKGTTGSPIRLFQFPNTLAGDTAVTIFIQFLTTWVIEALLVNHDLRKGGVQPIGFIPEPRGRWLRWFALLDQHQCCQQRGETQTETETHTASGSSNRVPHWLTFLFSQILRSLILAVIFFTPIFGISVGFLTIVGERHLHDWDWYYSAKWAPQIFKLVQGAVLGLLFTPPMVMFWLAKCGWAQRAKEAEHLQQSDDGEDRDNRGGNSIPS